MRSLLPAVLATLLAAGCNCGDTITKKGGGELKVEEKQVDFGSACPKPTDPALKVEVASKSVHVKNQGNALLELNKFEVEAAKASLFVLDKSKVPPSLAAGEAIEVPITFTPAEPGTAAADLTIEGDEEGKPPTVVKLLGEGKNLPQNPTLSMSCPGGKFSSDGCAAANPNLFFPDTPMNGVSEMTLVLKNGGCPAMEVFDVVVTTDTSLGDDPGTFALAESQPTQLVVVGTVPGNVKLRFSPKVSNSFQGKLTFKSNDPAQKTVAIAIRGVGIVPVIDLSPTLCDFKPRIGFCSGVFHLKNSGQQDLVLNKTTIKSANPMFKLTKWPATGTKIPANGSLPGAIEVEYLPGLKIGSDFLVVDSSGGTATAEIRGGSPPVIRTDPEAFLDFGTKLSTTKEDTKDVKIFNVETYNKQLPLTVASVEIDSRPPSNAAKTFDIPAGSTLAGAKINPGSDATTKVHFKSAPNGGNFVANLLIKTDDPSYSPPNAEAYLLSVGASTTCNPAPVAEITSPTTTTCSGSCTGQARCIGGVCHAAGSISISIASQKTVDLSGGASYDLSPDAKGDCTSQDTTGIEKWEWTLPNSGKPSGSNATITPTGIGAAAKTVLTVDRQGAYLIRLYVYDKTGLKSPVTTFTVNVGQ